jgi:hypothetical protein
MPVSERGSLIYPAGVYKGPSLIKRVYARAVIYKHLVYPRRTARGVIGPRSRWGAWVARREHRSRLGRTAVRYIGCPGAASSVVVNGSCESDNGPCRLATTVHTDRPQPRASSADSRLARGARVGASSLASALRSPFGCPRSRSLLAGLRPAHGSLRSPFAQAAVRPAEEPRAARQLPALRAARRSSRAPLPRRSRWSRLARSDLAPLAVLAAQGRNSRLTAFTARSVRGPPCGRAARPARRRQQLLLL